MGHIKMIQSGKMIEVFEYEKEIPTRSPFRKARRKIKLSNMRTRTIRRDNSSQQKKSFRRIVTSNIDGKTKPALLTLTMFEIVSLRNAQIFFVDFIKKLRRVEGKVFRYVAVPEFQKRGAVHFHVMIWGLNEKIIQSEYETRYLQGLWQRGYLDCLETDGSPKLIGYISKYMSKSLQNPLLMGSRAYMCSNNVLRPVSLSTKTAASIAAENWDINLETTPALLEREFSTQWLGKGRYRLFEI